MGLWRLLTCELLQGHKCKLLGVTWCCAHVLHSRPWFSPEEEAEQHGTTIRDIYQDSIADSTAKFSQNMLLMSSNLSENSVHTAMRPPSSLHGSVFATSSWPLNLGRPQGTKPLSIDTIHQLRAPAFQSLCEGFQSVGVPAKSSFIYRLGFSPTKTINLLGKIIHFHRIFHIKPWFS